MKEFIYYGGFPFISHIADVVNVHTSYSNFVFIGYITDFVDVYTSRWLPSVIRYTSLISGFSGSRYGSGTGGVKD